MAKILLIDDDEALVTIFSTALQKAGFEVVSALNGANGIEKAKNEKPDIILLDQVIPDIGGNDVLKTLKQDSDTKNIPVAMLSNFGQNKLVEDAITLGASDYILKYQVEPQDVIKKVQEILKGSKTPAASA